MSFQNFFIRLFRSSDFPTRHSFLYRLTYNVYWAYNICLYITLSRSHTNKKTDCSFLSLFLSIIYHQHYFTYNLSTQQFSFSFMTFPYENLVGERYTFYGFVKKILTTFVQGHITIHKYFDCLSDFFSAFMTCLLLYIFQRCVQNLLNL